jgi:hypothetical protein
MSLEDTLEYLALVEALVCPLRACQKNCSGMINQVHLHRS